MKIILLNIFLSLFHQGRARSPSEPWLQRRFRAYRSRRRQRSEQQPPYPFFSTKRIFKYFGRLIFSAGFVLGQLTSLEAADELTQEQPQYGGTLNVGTVYLTLSALSWDPADWAWKGNHDHGMARELLLAADLDKSIRKGGTNSFHAEAWLTPDAMRGELAESWFWEDELTLVINLRKGILFPKKEGLMEERELDAEDVVYSFHVVNDSPKKIPTYLDHIKEVIARDKHTVVFHFNFFHSMWPYRYGYGFYCQIMPREMANVDPKDWKNVHGTGPFSLERYVLNHAQIYKRNPNYWDKERIGNQAYQIPFVERVTYRIFKDVGSSLAAFRTGQIDIMEPIRWIMVDHLKETTPELKWSRWLRTDGTFLSMRVDQKPFDDIRVRRAMNLAVNQKEILELFFGGYGELMSYPQHPGFGDYYQPMEEMPDSIKELYEYKPDKAKALLAEAGYPDGFSFTVQASAADPANLELVSLLENYFSKVGVKMIIEPLEYAAFLSVLTTKTHTAGYFLRSGHTNPVTSLRKSFFTGQTWNPSMYSDPEFDKRIYEIYEERDEAKRVQIVRELTIEMLDKAPYVWLPTEYIYTAWWPWVKNYGGELRAGAVKPGPIYSRLWIDQKMKEELGFK